MNHSPVRSVLFSTFLLFVLLLPNARAEPTDLNEIKAYLVEIRDHLTDSYAFARDLTPSQLLQQGKQELLQTLKRTETSPFPFSNRVTAHLVDRLGDRSHRSIDDFIEDVRHTRNAFPSEPVDPLPIADVYASGMIKATGDSFSDLLTLEDVREIRDRLLGRGTNRSLGFHVTRENNRFRVNYVVFRSAAYRAGLRSGDVIVSVDGQDLSETSERERSSLLKADPGKNVNVTFYRDGWNRPHDVRLTQMQGSVETVESKLLPSNVGYVRLTSFGLLATGELRSALKDLREQGMESIILDLRNNPGGALPVAVSVADLFIPGNAVITTTDSNYELKGTLARIVRELLGFKPLSGTRRAGTSSPFEEAPMCVLINGSTASASEMTTGALQDHGRATVIGRTSFGKGIGQVAIPLMSSRNLESSDELGVFGNFLPSRFLYLTVMTYRLPSGRNIHKKGIKPDIPVSPDAYPESMYASLLKLRSSDVLSSYVRKHVRKKPDRMASLADYDGFKPKRYPGFGTLYETVRDRFNPGISTSVLRRELRRALRNYLRIYRNRTFTVDLQNDPILQQGILHLEN